ncbi:hypothetical protein SAMN05216323_10449 [Williamwhitmania taraxaci]|uniref:Uncharacterized protein n=2 Tax=Williamwhitmania taraxaci TaxID=1640674 RepID=A0A1G6NL72_9BACT|nr:hypothetical protein SAMN05216323_10449 [Williamwhitmania taraxaci]
MKTSDLLAQVKEKTGVSCIGLERKIARIRHNVGSNIADIQGWDVVVRGNDGSCMEYYVAQPPMMGMTQPQPISCPLGIIAFDDYKIDIKEAIEIFKTQNGGDKFTEISLSWPLVHPAAPEPFWHFRTNLGHTVVIGANSGQVKGFPTNVILYMAKPK